jgi:arginase family enzyme
VLIEEKIIYPEDVILIGIRNWDEEEVNYLKEKNIKYYRAKDIFEKGVKKTIKEILSLILQNNKQLYLSLDIDVVDPTEAIGTGYLEHGGLSSRELIYLLQEIKKTKLITHADIVEVNPEKDIKDMTSKLAAKCLIELANFQ